MNYPKRLIEVDLPIKRISAHARREKSIRHGHISTLHIWWARRPLAACRAVICASLWPDPADPLCPQVFRDESAKIISAFAIKAVTSKLMETCSTESVKRWTDLSRRKTVLKATNDDDLKILRASLLDFIADFSNWDNSTVKEYLEAARALTQTAHEALGGDSGTRPMVVDPFAGGGSIPLEALRVGADAFASDLNPVAVLLNKVMLEYIPKYGQRLADEVRKWGDWVKKETEKELVQFYPKDRDGSTPIAYLWARTIRCEGPACGTEIPLLGRALIAHRKDGGIAIGLKSRGRDRQLVASIVEGAAARKLLGTCKGFVATCPRTECGYSTPKKKVQAQLAAQHGGADSSKLLVVLTHGKSGRKYRLANERDLAAFEAARNSVQSIRDRIPSEPIPTKESHRAVGSQLPLYGFRSWGDLFNSRQSLALLTFQSTIRKAYETLALQEDRQLSHAVFLLLAFALDKQADYLSTLCRWVSSGEFIAGTLAGEKKLPMIADFAEANPIAGGSGSWENQIDWIARVIERESCALPRTGIAINSSADDPSLPADAASALVTDPPYYDSVPYADLSDFFYVWLKRTLHGLDGSFKQYLTPKEKEMTVNHPDNKEEQSRYESLLTAAFANSRVATTPGGVGVIVFAHKSTSGWEALLEAIVKSGWIVTASWPVDTERTARLNALNTASLSSSVHIICRPRKMPDGSLQTDQVGDWRGILAELPKRIHEWMPRLAQEGVVGADAIFACLGPALEIFSRYSKVEKASGEQIMLKEYLEHVWAAVAKEALNVIFEGADATGFEEDARLTAMWLWTLRTDDRDDANGEDDDEEASDEEEGRNGKKKALAGYVLEYDAARKIAQGLGAHLERLVSLVEVKGETARLLPVEERARYLFGKDTVETQAKRKKKERQLTMFEMVQQADSSRPRSSDKGGISVNVASTVLDRVHQSMLLFATGRSEALRRFLVEDGIGRDQRFWILAQHLTALYPKDSNERRWVEGVLARKKGLGF